jgi:metal-responsive CopG/Arc/MetJ family transcriptional regulator
MAQLIHLTIPQDQLTVLDDYCKQTGTNRSVVMRTAIQLFIAAQLAPDAAWKQKAIQRIAELQKKQGTK